MLLTAAMGRALCFTVSHHDPVGDPAVYLNESLASAARAERYRHRSGDLDDLRTARLRAAG